MKIRIAILAGLALLSPATGAWAQGCALCYTTASATSAAAQRSLNVGIFALLAPALVLFLSVMFLLYRRAIAAA